MVEPSPKEISSLRDAFLSAPKSILDNVHPNDMQRIKDSDNWLKRFLMHHENNEKLALEMMYNACAWRVEQKCNEISTIVRKDYLIEGGFFPFGKDKDGCTMLVFKCKKHVKGARDIEEVKRAVIYWLERLEKEENGRPITLFFDMDGCGLSNMDLEFTKFLVHIMKEYYPYYLNYIVVFEMAWILNAAFKVIKSWMPEKAREKIKMLKKSELKEIVPVEQQMTSWGGSVDYTFSFVEPDTTSNTSQSTSTNKKVHFADGSEMSDSSPVYSSGDKEDGAMLSVHPSTIITFVEDGDELTSTLELKNVDASRTVSFKLKTTSPEKFRVRPSTGCLAPGGRMTVNVNLLAGFQLGGLSRDKFLVMSMPLKSSDMSATDLIELWKNVDSKEVTQHRLSCTQASDRLRNGNIAALGSPSMSDQNAQITKMMSSISQLSESNTKLQGQVKMMHILQIILIIALIAMAITLTYVIRTEMKTCESTMSCVSHNHEL